MAVFEPEAEGIVLDAEETGGDVVGRSPWALAGRRLLRNKLALGAGALFLVIVAVSLAAPLYARHVAQTDPFEPNLSGTFELNGKTIQVIQQGGGKLGLGETPVGPTWHSKYLLGADQLGRDVMARVLYGGRASLFIYWIHVELVYGYASWLWRGRLPLWATAIAFVAFCIAMYGAVILRDRILDNWRRIEPDPVVRGVRL